MNATYIDDEGNKYPVKVLSTCAFGRTAFVKADRPIFHHQTNHKIRAHNPGTPLWYDDDEGNVYYDDLDLDPTALDMLDAAAPLEDEAE